MILVIRWELFFISLKIISLHYSPWLFSFPIFRFLEVCWICLSAFKSKLELKQCINSTCLHKIESWLQIWNHSFKDANLLILIRSKWKKWALADINLLDSNLRHFENKIDQFKGFILKFLNFNLWSMSFRLSDAKDNI